MTARRSIALGRSASRARRRVAAALQRAACGMRRAARPGTLRKVGRGRDDVASKPSLKLGDAAGSNGRAICT